LPEAATLFTAGNYLLDYHHFDRSIPADNKFIALMYLMEFILLLGWDI